ncbi:MAG: hypothetical protein UX85_C0003G0064 [Candidatus Beckwithbacteria bacterium GW2011_GWB1_47_15]|uniref:Polymorphic outer membrane protein n=1 Tax=Candidatus Beckwithbacteria bacterium GW2011_GWB1_47_15 TaxID=1618371 RepID=A0A0G1UUK7_9BACT|nr:MAG: Uncharacterized protein UY43_C0001G0399 [Candidatus Beckwithbacteria bacterium GW2011_GWC1_49_16]KKU35310.1 MAG: hypothetical protein UX50_C0004G0041 [Candidatus Beckwithbacteria bacterium GW2011_GWA1_46_30]KKU61405.1 MAG: hypothetical protein UX85_C0003G0064 [Candidatus Beckwithbacteria bacterium GW2011_GWB1_47_15]KKU71812.1 MAG: hypothetical protein UX97_C0003G0041 [Candidatus Beckwithbacteria bacterium GW2011_GWA2_47_25]OGD48758.1 MAG: hypothetical protein A2877_03740 [Candidatus Bec
MKKEVLIAVVSGLILGLIITFGIYTANKSLEQQKLKQSQGEISVTPPPSSDLSQKTLTITSHQTNDLVNQSDITLSGIAWPGAIIAVISETDQVLLQADEEGIFATDVTLIKGFNELTIVASDETNTTQTQNLIITYSTTELIPPQTEESQDQ